MENELEKLKKENKIMKMELEKTQQLVEELRKKVDGKKKKIIRNPIIMKRIILNKIVVLKLYHLDFEKLIIVEKIIIS